MRELIVNSIFERMATDPDVFFLTADMGINLVEKFQERYPSRYANVGIAEQNLIGVSAGLANVGYRPFAYTISNFVVHRCLEQIRNDIALHAYPITLLGTSTGYDNAPLGPTHHIVDDWGVLKGLPEIDIYCPSSITYARGLVERILSTERPAYVRIPKGGFIEPLSDEHMVKLDGSSDEVLLVSYGSPAQACIRARALDPRISVLVINRLRPLDERQLSTFLEPHRRVIVVEDHFSHSGLYGSLCEFIVRTAFRGRIESLAPTGYIFDVGQSPHYFHKKFGLDIDGILKVVGE